MAVALLSFTSCSKECKCKQYVNDEVVLEYTIELEGNQKCKDFNSKVAVLGVSQEVKCK